MRPAVMSDPFLLMYLVVVVSARPRRGLRCRSNSVGARHFIRSSTVSNPLLSGSAMTAITVSLSTLALELLHRGGCREPAVPALNRRVRVATGLTYGGGSRGERRGEPGAERGTEWSASQPSEPATRTEETPDPLALNVDCPPPPGVRKDNQISPAWKLCHFF